MNKRILLILTSLIFSPLAGLTDNIHMKNKDDMRLGRMSENNDEVKFNKIVENSAEVYSAIARGPHGEVPQSVLRNARCIAIIPEVITGAIVVGGAHGKGLASCKDKDSNWSQPAPISFNQGSIGLQAGGKSTDLVLFFQNNESVQALKKGEFGISTDVSVVAGKYDSSMDTSNAGVVVYSRTEGLFAGASINGGKIGKNKEKLAAYYGKDVDYASILEGRQSPDLTGYTKKLTKLFP